MCIAGYFLNFSFNETDHEQCYETPFPWFIWFQNKEELQRCHDNKTKLEHTIDAMQKDIVVKKQTVAMVTMDIQVCLFSMSPSRCICI